MYFVSWFQLIVAGMRRGSDYSRCDCQEAKRTSKEQDTSLQDGSLEASFLQLGLTNLCHYNL